MAEEKADEEKEGRKRGTDLVVGGLFPSRKWRRANERKQGEGTAALLIESRCIHPFITELTGD